MAGRIQDYGDDDSLQLRKLGINKEKDLDGSEQLIIHLRPSDLDVTEGKAVYDKRSKDWKFVTTSSSKNKGETATPEKRDFMSNGGLVAGPDPVEWTKFLPQNSHVDIILKDIDWALTPLGPIKHWPISLQTYVTMILIDPEPAVIYWGEDLTAIYNEPMNKTLSGRQSHPGSLLGKRFEEIWPEWLEEYGSKVKSVVADGQILTPIDATLTLVNHGYLEETFWTGSFLPILGTETQSNGILNRILETTRDKIAARRNKVLNSIAASYDTEKDSVWQHIFKALAINELDFPMAFVYSAHEDSSTSRCTLNLQQTLGFPATGHPLVPPQIDLYEGHSGYTPLYRRSKSLDQPLVLHVSDETLPSAFVNGFEWRGFGEAAKSIAIMSISSSSRLLGVLVIALNPRRPYNDDYEGFISTLSRHVSLTVTRAIDREEGRNRADRLQRQLDDSEKHIRELAEYGPVGICRVAITGKISWANPQFYEITGHGKKEEDQYELSFVDVVDPIDQANSAGLWPVLLMEHKSVSAPLRLKRRWRPPIGEGSKQPEEEPAWILASAYPIIEDGEVKSIAAAVTDISLFKWAEATQTRNLETAKEAKKLQENFIDIVSHEMRNPLSAITQLADGISSSLDDLKEQEDIQNAKDILASNVEGANTILLCAAHQKRIIDDVLTLSKLDSVMLSITPVVVQPLKVVQSVLRMFEAEFQTSSIKVENVTDKTYNECHVDWVSVDPSRLTQIFINLVTNAIKFTKLETRREISLHTGASRTKPPQVADISWFPTDRMYQDPTTNAEWGTGEPLYLWFRITDTGPGLEQEEMKKLFNRFQQATAKTHIKYGGSGLGLFISRELTETQGGEIGVISKPGKGSTFAFYIKVRRAEEPSEPTQLLPPPKAEPNSSKDAKEMVKQAAEQENQSLLNDKQASTNATSQTPPTNHSYTILVVEDNIVNARVLNKQLTRSKCTVHTANHGMEALDHLQKSSTWHTSTSAAPPRPPTLSDSAMDIDSPPSPTTFDVILMDIEMPIMDGLTCTRRIRQLEADGKITRHTNIIACTANARKEQIDMALHAGADEVLTKPFRVAECLALVARVVQRTQKRDT